MRDRGWLNPNIRAAFYPFAFEIDPLASLDAVKCTLVVSFESVVVWKNQYARWGLPSPDAAQVSAPNTADSSRLDSSRLVSSRLV